MLWFDSDTMLITNNKVLVNAANKNYGKFKVSTDKIKTTKRLRNLNWEEKSDLDVKTGNNKIGEIINLAQILMSIFWDKLNNGENFDDIKYIHYDICQLNVLSGIEIDKAKKEYTIDSTKELTKIRKKYKNVGDDNKSIQPYFFKFISQNKGHYAPDKINYTRHNTTMDYIESEINKYQRNSISLNKKTFIEFNEILRETVPPDSSGRRQFNRIISLIKEYKRNYKIIYGGNWSDSNIKYKLLCLERQRIIEYIGNLKFNEPTMKYMLTNLSKKKYDKEFKSVYEFLFGYPNTSFYEIIKLSKDNIYSLKRNELTYDYIIFSLKYEKHTKTA